MTRWILGALILGSMSSTGYVLIRPRVHRPTLAISSVLPKDDPRSEALYEGIRLALEERDGRGGVFKVLHHATATEQAWPVYQNYAESTDDNSNSSYAALGLRRVGAGLPGLEGRTLASWPSEEGGVLVPLRIEDEKDRVTEAARVLGKTAQTWHPANGSCGEVASNIRTVPLDVQAVDVSLKPKVRIPPVRIRRKVPPAEHIGEGIGRALQSNPGLIYLDCGAWTEAVWRLREAGFQGEILVPSDRLAKDPSRANGCLTILSRLHPLSPEFARKARSSDPLAGAAYRSCLRYLDALDRSAASAPADVFKSCDLLDPFLDPGTATVGVYRIRSGGFERVRTLP